VVDKGEKKKKTGEISFLIPSPEDMLLHLCVSMYHNNYNKTALRGLCDIIHTIHYFSEETDWALFREVVRQSETARWFIPIVPGQKIF